MTFHSTSYGKKENIVRFSDGVDNLEAELNSKGELREFTTTLV